MTAQFRRSSQPKPIRTVLSGLLKNLGLEKAVRQQRALELWPSVVGEYAARATTPLRIENGKLFVQVSSPAWRMELFQQREVFRARLNEALGHPDVQEIVLV